MSEVVERQISSSGRFPLRLRQGPAAPTWDKASAHQRRLARPAVAGDHQQVRRGEAFNSYWAGIYSKLDGAR
jgi:hypothetical protein